MPKAAASTRQIAYTRKLEEDYQRRIIELLEPMIGVGRVRATVTADADFTVAEETHEIYDPQKTAVRSEHTSNERAMARTAPRAFRGAQQSAAGDLGRAGDRRRDTDARNPRRDKRRPRPAGRPRARKRAPATSKSTAPSPSSSSRSAS